MADDFAVDTAQTVSLFVESLFYGIYLITFGMCMYTMLVKSRSRARQRIIFLIVASLLFIVGTFDMALMLRHVLDAFIWYRGPGGPNGEFAIISYWVNVMKTATYEIQTSIADGMLIYRCYIVYGRSWLVATPLCVIWAAGIAVAVMAPYLEFNFHHDATLSHGADNLTPFITTVLFVTLALNLIATSLIVYRIWSIERQTRALIGTLAKNDGNLRRAMRIIVESGFVYTVSVAIFAVTYLAKDNSEYVISSAAVQIAGICFNLIIIRVDQSKTVETTAAYVSAFVVSPDNTHPSGQRTQSQAIELGRLGVTEDSDAIGDLESVHAVPDIPLGSAKLACRNSITSLPGKIQVTFAE